MSTIALALALSTVAALAAHRLRRIVWMTRVTSRSMYPTLRPGQRVVTRRVGGTSRLHRGDIVVADSTELGRRIIKRVVGLPGDRVQVGEQGLTINGAPAREPYVTSPGGAPASFTVPRRAVLLLGDNRSESNDSRSWARPYLPLDQIKGRVPRRHPASDVPTATSSSDPRRDLRSLRP